MSSLRPAIDWLGGGGRRPVQGSARGGGRRPSTASSAESPLGGAHLGQWEDTQELLHVLQGILSRSDVRSFRGRCNVYLTTVVCIFWHTRILAIDANQLDAKRERGGNRERVVVLTRACCGPARELTYSQQSEVLVVTFAGIVVRYDCADGASAPPAR